MIRYCFFFLNILSAYLLGILVWNICTNLRKKKLDKFIFDVKLTFCVRVRTHKNWMPIFNSGHQNMVHVRFHDFRWLISESFYFPQKIKINIEISQPQPFEGTRHDPSHRILIVIHTTYQWFRVAYASETYRSSYLNVVYISPLLH